MEKNRPLQLFWILAIVVLIASCGGGGGSNDTRITQITQGGGIVAEPESPIVQADDVVVEQERLAGQYTLVAFELFENGEVLTQDNFFQYSGVLNISENGSFTSDLTLNNEPDSASSGTWTVTQAGMLRVTDQFGCTSSASYELLSSSDLRISSSDEACGRSRQTKTWRINADDGSNVVNSGPDGDAVSGDAGSDSAGGSGDDSVVGRPSYTIGDTGPGGGIVFAVDATGSSGLEAARINQAIDASWCVDTVDVPGVDNTQGIDTLDTQTGAENTPAIIASCPTSGTAAEVASQYVWPNGQTDGFLPNKEELNLLYEQRDVVGGFDDVAVWSSSEFDSERAWFQDFGNGENHRLVQHWPARVRAVRAF